MATPNRIREEAAAAEAKLRELAAAPAPVVVPAGAPTNPPTEADPVEPVSLDDRPPGEEPHPNAVQDPPSGEPITGEAYAQLMQRYETLQGLHNRDQQKLHQAEGRLEVIERMLLAQQQARAAEPPPSAPVRTPPKLVDDKEIEEFGPDLIDVTRRIAREEFRPVIDDLLDQVQAITAKLNSMSQTVGATAQIASTAAEERFETEMNRLVKGADGTPDWQQINESQNFIDWCQQVGQDSYEPRIKVLQHAYQRKDAQKCAGFFNAYKRDKGLPTGETSGAPSQAPASPAAAFVSPSPVAPAAPTNNRGAKKSFTIAQVEKVYSDFTKGVYKGKENEYRALTAEIDKAFAEGRITTK